MRRRIIAAVSDIVSSAAASCRYAITVGPPRFVDGQCVVDVHMKPRSMWHPLTWLGALLMLVYVACVIEINIERQHEV